MLCGDRQSNLWYSEWPCVVAGREGRKGTQETYARLEELGDVGTQDLLVWSTVIYKDRSCCLIWLC